MTQRKTKIIATLGPSSSSLEKILMLIQSGVDIFRLNFSHGTHADHKQRIEFIQQAKEKLKTDTQILMDLQGPKLRVGRFENTSVTLANNDVFCFDQDPALGNNKRVCLPHPEIFQAMSPGETLLLDDGKIRMRVLECNKDLIKAQVEIGGKLSNNKGVNVPGACLNLSALTEKDKKDLEFGLPFCDIVALSFVQTPQDVIEAKSLVQQRAKIMVKIEKPQAFQHIDKIIDESDCIMVARGDLAVEVSHERVPILQRQLIEKCKQKNKFCAVATQMLESMISSPVPTRAEASDVATAVYLGANAVTLSAESASGQYPLETVQMMDKIIHAAEEDVYN